MTTVAVNKIPVVLVTLGAGKLWHEGKKDSLILTRG